MSLTQKYAPTYDHVQSAPATAWVINHNLGIYPAIDIYIDFEGEKHKILPMSVEYTDANTCTVNFSSAQTGLAAVA